MSDTNSDSNDGLPKLPTIKPNPNASKGPYVLPPIHRQKAETHDKSSSDESSEDEKSEGEIISQIYLSS